MATLIRPIHKIGIHDVHRLTRTIMLLITLIVLAGRVPFGSRFPDGVPSVRHG
jgi:hypothetical protein